MRRFWLQTTALIVAAFSLAAASPLVGGTSPLLFFVDVLSIVGLLQLVFGAAFWVFQSGLFDRFIRSFKRYTERTDKLGEYVAEQSGKEFGGIQSTMIRKLSVTYPLLVSGGIAFACSYVLSVLLF